MSERRRIITQIKALLAELESDAPLAPSAPSAPEPAPADGWKRARLGKVFLDPTKTGGVKVTAFFNWRENGEERSDKFSTFDEALMAQLQGMERGEPVEYTTKLSKCGKYVNLAGVRSSRAPF